MIKDIYVKDGWYNNNILTLLRNDNKEIPIDLKHVERRFTWYYNDTEEPTADPDDPTVDPGTDPIDPDPQNPGDDPVTPDPQPETPNIYNVHVQQYNTAQGFVNCSDHVEEGQDLTITVYPTGTYEIDTFTVNGVATTQNPYTVYNVHDNVTVAVTFKPKQTPNPDQPTDPDPQTPDPQTGFNIPQAVDLGLSVKWANFNIGATQPSEVGNYIKWGDPTGTSLSIDYGFYVDTTDIGGDSRYDTATALFGGNWRMPTRAQFKELQDNTTISYETVNGVDCYKFTARNGNYIYMPISGLYTNESSNPTDYKQTAYGWYWTSESESSTIPYLACLYSNHTIDIQISSISYRMPIRAVYQTSQNQQPQEPTPTETSEAGNAVDLGLSVKWANKDVGSTSQSIIGDYLTWGATQTQSGYTVADYVYGNSTDLNGMVYLAAPGSDLESQERASYSIGNTQYDAAHVRWGGTWRMPTPSEINELIEECTWVWTSRNDTTNGTVWGFEVSRNGNSIFLPAGGRMIEETEGNPYAYGENDLGYFWSDHAYWGPNWTNLNKEGEVLVIASPEMTQMENKAELSHRERTIGAFVRPVCS